MRYTLVLSLVIAVLMVVFALMNNDDMTVYFGFFEATGPTALVLLITFVLGVAAGVLGTIPGRMKKKRKQGAPAETTKQGVDAPPPSAAATPERDPSRA